MNTVLLKGIVGSQAYGLANDDSDVDHLGVYAAPTSLFHGLNPPMDKKATIVHSNPDFTSHEALKFAKLCLGGNPTVTELMWLDEYEVMTDLGRELIRIRTAFLSRQRVMDAYIGYAASQFKRLVDTGQFQSKQRARASKHSRHMLRLIHQGQQLYATGMMTIRLEDPAWFREEGDRIAADHRLGRPYLMRAQMAFKEFKSPLPEHPDYDKVEAWLQSVRAAHL